MDGQITRLKDAPRRVDPPPYSSKIIKAGALLSDTKTLLAHWDTTCPVPENLARIRLQNVFGKASSFRVEDILTVFRQRYLADEETLRALVAGILVQAKIMATDAVNQPIRFCAENDFAA